MTWTPKQIDAAHVARGPHRSPGAPAISDAEVVAIMDSTRDALAAIGGTMTAEQLAGLATFEAHVGPKAGRIIREYIAAQGAKVAALRDELTAHTRLGVEVAQVLAECGGVLGEGILAGAQRVVAKVAALEADAETLEATIRADRQHDALLKGELGGTSSETLRGAAMRVKKERDAALADVKRLTREREEALDRAARSELARLKPSGPVADLVSRVALMVGSREKSSQARADLDCLAALAQRGQEASSSLAALLLCATKASAELRHAYRPETRDWDLVARAIRILEEVTTPNAPHHPCSPACASHAHVGQDGGGKTLDGVSEQGGTAPPDAPGRVVYEAGAEDMRTACWEAVAMRLEAEGYDRAGALLFGLKAAIDGATP